MYKRNKPHTLETLMARTLTNGDCIIWTGALKSNGYGVTHYQNRQEYVHRLIYKLVIGGIPKDTEIDHTCNVRNCVNPQHLQAVTHQKNMELGSSRRDTCRNGHEWNDKNTYIAKVKRKQGGYRMQRYCRVCRCQHQKDLRGRNLLTGVNTKQNR